MVIVFAGGYHNFFSMVKEEVSISVAMRHSRLNSVAIVYANFEVSTITNVSSKCLMLFFT